MLTMWQLLSAKKLALTSLTSGGRSVSIVRFQIEAMEDFLKKIMANIRIDGRCVEIRI
jgi:hypothetical protein